MKILCLLAILAVMLVSTQATIHHLTDRNFNQKINQSPYTLVYFYSSSCKFCKEFTPKFQKLSKNQQLINLNISFAKIDAPAYKNFTQQFQVNSYPTIALFFNGIPLPVYYRRQRQEKPLTDYLLNIIKPFDQPHILEQIKKLTPQQSVGNKYAIFKGKRDSLEFKLWDIIAKRDGYIEWAFVEAETPKVVIGTKQFDNFEDLDLLEREVEASYARLHRITEESWLKLVDKKRFTIVYINKFSTTKTKQLLQKLVLDFPNLHFLEIDAEQEDYKDAVRFLGLNDEENIVAVDKLYDVMYVAPSPYTESGLKQFIEKAKDHKLDIYRKSESTNKPNKLTRNNYEERMSTNQDVLLFLYDRKQPISKQLMHLFEYLLVKLQDNKNLLLLRCDIMLNEIEEKLGFLVKKPPRIVFFRNKMKDYPIHFSAKTLSPRAVLDFIMENTTFDFQDSWAEL